MIKFLFGIVLIVSGFYRTIFVDPVWGLYLFAALTHIRLTQLGENIALPLQVPMAIACLTLIMYLASPRYDRKFSKWSIDIFLMACMVIGMAISSWGAEFNSEVSWKFTSDFAKYFVFFVILVNMVDSLEKVEWFHRTLILAAVWLVYRCWDLRGTTGARFENIGGDVISDGNHYAAALVFLFPFVFQKCMSKDRRISIGAAILCFGIIMAIFISGSRGGLLGITALGVWLIVAFKEQRKKVLLVAISVGLISVLFMNDFQKERLSDLFSATSEETRDSSAQGRIDFWKLALELFKENPVAGVGLGNFPYHAGYRVEGLRKGEPGHVTHSLWFEVISEGGLVVTVPLLLLFYRFYRNTKRAIVGLRIQQRTEEILYITTARVALGAFLVCATFLNRLIYEPIYWCIGLGVIHCYLTVNQEKGLQERKIGRFILEQKQA